MDIGRDGIIRAGHAINEGVTDHIYWPQDGAIDDLEVTNFPHRTPPRNDKMTAP